MSGVLETFIYYENLKRKKKTTQRNNEWKMILCWKIHFVILNCKKKILESTQKLEISLN